MNEQTTGEPLIDRKLRYASLMESFGGSPYQWSRMKEKDIRLYLHARDSIIRKRKRDEIMMAEQMKRGR